MSAAAQVKNNVDDDDQSEPPKPLAEKGKTKPKKSKFVDFFDRIPGFQEKKVLFGLEKWTKSIKHISTKEENEVISDCDFGYAMHTLVGGTIGLIVVLVPLGLRTSSLPRMLLMSAAMMTGGTIGGRYSNVSCMRGLLNLENSKMSLGAYHMAKDSEILTKRHKLDVWRQQHPKYFSSNRQKENLSDSRKDEQTVTAPAADEAKRKETG